MTKEALRDLSRMPGAALRRSQAHLRDSLSRHRDSMGLGVLATAMIAFGFGAEKGGPIDPGWLSPDTSTDPNWIMKNLLTHVANIGNSIIRLLEAGQAYSARALVRALDEHCVLAVCCLFDRPTMIAFAMTPDDPNARRKHFFQRLAKKHLFKRRAEVERALGVSIGDSEDLEAQREAGYAHYSDFVHGGFQAAMIGAYAFDPKGSKAMQWNILGEPDRASRGVLVAASRQIALLNLAIFGGLVSKHAIGVSAPWLPAFGIHRTHLRSVGVRDPDGWLPGQ